MKRSILHIQILSLSILLAVLCPPAAMAQEAEAEAVQQEEQEEATGLSATATAAIGNIVGSPQGQFAVSPTGAATYSVAIEVPPGIGGMQPQIGIAYNSQAGMGNAGWGCSITGVSSITRGVKDIYHDGKAKGIGYANGDAYFLDGKRLVYASGTEGAAGCLYHPEGDPFTDVTIKNGSYGTYFEVITPDGNTAVYGDDYNSRTRFYSGGQKVAAWHLKSIANAAGRAIYYTYDDSDYYHCVSKITYYTDAADAVCTVNFTYVTLGSAAQKFRLMDVEGKIDKRLTGITCKTGGTVCRVYTLTYNTTYDGTAVKFPRLTSISVSDGNGNSLRPITLAWEYLPAFACSNTTECNFAANYPSGTQITDRMFMACDMNGDGIDDIIQVATDTKSQEKLSFISLHQSTRENNGNIWFYPTSGFSFAPDFSNEKYKWTWKRSYHMGDIDGDGLNDFLMPELDTSGDVSTVRVYPFYGSSSLQNSLPSNPHYSFTLEHSDTEIPIYAVSDVDNNGICEFLVLERTLSGGHGILHAVTVSPERTASVSNYYFSLPSAPRRMFAADFNGDGLQDLFILCHSGYKVFWNQGGYPGYTFPHFYWHFSDASSACVTGTDVADVQNVEIGDFNGDGLPDFILNEKNSDKYRFALNNGDGTFTLSDESTIDVFDEDKNEDDDKYTMLVSDFDHDGKSDVFIAHAHYKHHGGLNPHNTYEYTDVRWYRSTGTSLELMKSVQTKNEKDAQVGHIILGDIDGDGRQEIVSYGSDLTTSATYYRSVTSRFYTDNTTTATGKVSAVTDGFAGSTQISYASLTSPSVYTKGTGCTYPLADLSVPLHVVSSVTVPTAAGAGGAAASMTETYSYAGLKAHVAGRGLLGFAETTVANDVTGTTTVTGTSGWEDNIYFMPTRATSTTTLADGSTATAETAIAVVPKGTGVLKNCYSHPASVTSTDPDGYTTATTYTYDDSKGVVTLEKTVYDGGTATNYRQAAYTYGSTKYGGRWMPVQVVTTQKHPDDTQPFSTTRKITYDAGTGLPTQTVENYGTPLALTTSCTYSSGGNLTARAVSGSGLGTVTEKFEYDTSGRFVTKAYTVPASTVTTYTHDLWGNVLTETDATNTSYPLTTTNTYDGFGNLLTSTSPEGITTAVSRSWGTSITQKYSVHKTVTGRPWSKAWYDSRGRETRTEGVGPLGLELSSTATYDARGNVVARSSATGDVTTSSAMAYDGRGRLASETLSTGLTTSYAYTGRKVTATTSNGRTYEKTYDAWGLLKQSKEPIGTVAYTYKSCGKPSAAGSGTGTVTMTYDACGNQTGLTDPDAGTMAYSYNAAGEVVSQTDARGITTTHTRDALNRVTQTTTGSTTVTYTYGTSGTSAHRLTRQATGDKAVNYSYDQYGRLVAEVRVMGTTSYVTSYTYGTDGHLATVTYPGSVSVAYGYDAYGNETSMAVNGSTVWTLSSYDGTSAVETLGTGTSALRRSTSRNSHGLLTGITLQKASNSSVLHAMTFQHDPLTGNLTKRTGMVYDEFGQFTYDKADRLTLYTNGHWNKVTQYAANGNIEYRTDYGYYGYQAYQDTSKPHAVRQVGNDGSLIITSELAVTYNDLGMVSAMDIDHEGLAYTAEYGPDGSRWKTWFSRDSEPYDTLRYYIGSMEGYKAGPSDPVWFYHLGHGVILRKTGLSASAQPTVLYTFEDNLGSITRIYNSGGTAVFSAEYDPWGVQRQTLNTIGYHRGYCGHEMLNDFQLINMNGRLYDPYIARFLSPDNYVQMPTSAQSFNRYSYCLNNPLKYVDPDGEFFFSALLPGIGTFIDAACWGAVIGGAGYTASVAFSDGGFTNWNWGQFGKSIGFGAVSGIVTAGVGQAFGAVGSNGVMGEVSRALTHGLTNGIITGLQGGDPLTGFLSGSLSSLAGSAFMMYGGSLANSPVGTYAFSGLAGGVGSVLTGGNFWEGAAIGLMNAGLNHLQQGINSRLSLLFDGENLYVMDKEGNEVYSTPATSGKGEHMNNPASQKIENMGPIPEGKYSYKNSKWKFMTKWQQFKRLIRGGDWGSHNVPLDVVNNNNSTRRGFYLHGGIFKGSAGCIDAGSNIGKIYNLTKFQKITYVYVNY